MSQAYDSLVMAYERCDNIAKAEAAPRDALMVFSRFVNNLSGPIGCNKVIRKERGTALFLPMAV